MLFIHHLGIPCWFELSHFTFGKNANMCLYNKLVLISWDILKSSLWNRLFIAQWSGMFNVFERKVAYRGVLVNALTPLCYRKLGWSETIKRRRQPTDCWEKLHGLDCLERNLMKLEGKVKTLLNMHTHAETHIQAHTWMTQSTSHMFLINAQIISGQWDNRWKSFVVSMNFHTNVKCNTNVGEHACIVTYCNTKCHHNGVNYDQVKM